MQNQQLELQRERHPSVGQIEIEDAREFKEPIEQYKSPLRYELLNKYGNAVFFTAKMAVAAVCGVVVVLCIAVIASVFRSF